MAVAEVEPRDDGKIDDLSRLFLVVLHQMFPDAPADEERVRALEAHAADFATRVAEGEQYREALKITTLVNEVSAQGPEARHLCQEILAGVAAYLRGQPGDSAARGWLR